MSDPVPDNPTPASDVPIETSVDVHAHLTTLEPVPGRGFAILFVLTAILLYAGTVVINVHGNSTGLFHSRLNPALCERAWKTRRIDDAIARGQAPKVVVMGSSRIMQIQPEYLEALVGQGPAFNWGVSAAEAMDWLSQLRYLVSRGVAPKVIVLGVDDLYYGTLYNKYQIQLVSHWGLFNNVPLRERLLLGRDALLQVNFDETRKSFNTILKPPGPLLRSLKRTDHAILADGYLIYADRVELREKGRYFIGKRLENQARGFREIIAREADPLGALEPSSRKLGFLREFLDLAKANGIQVRVAHLPAHPAYEKLAHTPVIEAIRDRFGTIVARECEQRQFVYRDFRKLSSYGGSTEEWWDSIHQTPENLRRMMNALFDMPPGNIVKRVPTDRELLNRITEHVTDLNTR